MKICYIANGESIHTKRWVKWFADKGHEVHLISSNNSNVENVGFHHVDIIKGYYVPRLRYIRKIKQIIKEIKPDILHAHQVLGYGMYGALSGFHPFVVSAWGSDILIMAKKSIYNKLIVRYVFRKADAITATSNYLGSKIKEYTPRKEIHIIPFGVDTELFSPLPKKTGQSFTIGVTKPLKPIYGIEYLIKALPQLTAEILDLRVLLIGEGEQKQHLRELAKELGVENIVHFEGSVPHESIPQYLSMMDVFVMPSLSESFGVSALEAQAMKVPVVATNVGGIPEVVKDKISGLLVKPKDSKELADAIIKLLSDDALRQYMGENGRKFVIEKYEWERNAEEMEKLYKTLVRMAR